MEKNYKLTDDQFDMIRNALERYYYTCRDDSEFRKYLKPLEELERSLVAQKQQQEDFIKDMYTLINMCHHELTDEESEVLVLREIGIKVKEAYGSDAVEWGWDDTEIRDNVYRYMKREYKNKGLR